MARTRTTLDDNPVPGAPNKGTQVSGAHEIGAHLASFSPGWNALLSTQDAAVAIAEAGRLGYTSIALPLVYPNRYPIAEIRGALARASIAPVCLVALPPNVHLPARPEHARNWLGRALDVTEQLGGRLLGGALGWTPASAHGGLDTLESVDAGRALLVEVLRDLAQDAQRRGIMLALEPANRYETALCNTLQEGSVLVETIAMPNMGLLANTHHMHMEEVNPAKALLDAASHLFAVRLAENNRMRLGQGAVAWHAVWSALAAARFAGMLLVDAPIARAAESAQASALATADSPAAAAMRFVRAGMSGVAPPAPAPAAKARPARKKSSEKTRTKEPPAQESPAAKAPAPRKRSNTKSYRGRS